MTVSPGSIVRYLSSMEDKNMQYSGQWRITEMEQWDSDYLDMEVEAYIKIGPEGSGEFQFGLVFGQMDGEVVKNGDQERFEFTWDGNDECDPASGSGWLKLKDKNSLEGRVKFHQGDHSGLVAKRIK
jgi:hypothetical protein